MVAKVLWRVKTRAKWEMLLSSTICFTLIFFSLSKRTYWLQLAGGSSHCLITAPAQPVTVSSAVSTSWHWPLIPQPLADQLVRALCAQPRRGRSPQPGLGGLPQWDGQLGRGRDTGAAQPKAAGMWFFPGPRGLWPGRDVSRHDTQVWALPDSGFHDNVPYNFFLAWANISGGRGGCGRWYENKSCLMLGNNNSFPLNCRKLQNIQRIFICITFTWPSRCDEYSFFYKDGMCGL